MGRFTISLVAVFLLTSLLSDGKVIVRFGEPSPGTYLKTSEQSHDHLNAEELISATTALLNIGALSHVDAETSAKVSQIINGNPFQKPAAAAAFVVGGVHEGGAASFPGSVSSLEAAEKEVVLGALDSLSLAPSLEHTPLDIGSLPGCGNACLESALQEALVGLGLDANYSQGPASLSGTLSIRMSSSPQAAVFQLQSVADRMFSIELASTWKAVSDAVIERQRREGQDPKSYQKPQLIERLLISPQAVLNAHGKESQQYKAACCLIHQLVSDSVERLSKAYGNRLATIIATLDVSELGGDASEVVELINWSSRAQRPTRSLLAVRRSSDEDAYIQRYVAWIAMWGTFFLLLFFAISGCHCLRHMKFKQDSLLYGKNKTD